MPHPKGAGAFPHVRVLMDRALESEKGIEVELGDSSAAFKMRMNCYSVRKRDLKESRRLFPEGHPKHGRSVYDDLTFIQEGSKLRILKLSSLDFAIREI